MFTFKETAVMAILAVILQTTSLAHAADATVDTLVIDVGITKDKTTSNSVEIENTKAGAKATQDALQAEIANRAAGDAALQNSINTISLTPGPQGIQGETGPKGDNGDQGPAGADGAPGADGLNGSNGADSTVPGPQGVQGPAGPAGATGPDATARADLCVLYNTLNAQYSLGLTVPGYCYVIGDTGPAGGIVFYTTEDGHGLEAAPADSVETPAYGCDGTDIPGADGMAVFTGEQNTADIIAGCPGTNAASVAASYGSGWFLPSKDELNLLYGQRGVVPNLTILYYWSSSEDGSDFAWAQHFGNGSQVNYTKRYTRRVRAIRAF